MRNPLKRIWHRLYRLQFWALLYVQTILVGCVLLGIDYFYDGHIPQLLNTLDFPYFGLIMIVVGCYALMRLTFFRIDMVSILGSAAIWMYICLSTIQDLMDPHRPLLGLSAALGVMALMLCLRILGEASKLDLRKEQRISLGKKNRNGKLDK